MWATNSRQERTQQVWQYRMDTTWWFKARRRISDKASGIILQDWMLGISDNTWAIPDTSSLYHQGVFQINQQWRISYTTATSSHGDWYVCFYICSVIHNSKHELNLMYTSILLMNLSQKGWHWYKSLSVRGWISHWKMVYSLLQPGQQ